MPIDPGELDRNLRVATALGHASELDDASIRGSSTQEVTDLYQAVINSASTLATWESSNIRSENKIYDATVSKLEAKENQHRKGLSSIRGVLLSVFSCGLYYLYKRAKIVGCHNKIVEFSNQHHKLNFDYRIASIEKVSNASEEILNTAANLFLTDEEGKQIPLRKTVTSGTEWQRELAAWEPAAEGEQSLFPGHTVAPHDLPSMRKLKSIAAMNSATVVFNDAYGSKQAARKGETYLSKPIAEAMELANTPEERKTVAEYGLQPALEKFPGGQLVDTKKLRALIAHKAVQSNGMGQPLLDQAYTQNLTGVRSLQSGVLWEALVHQAVPKGTVREIVEAFDTEMASRGSQQLSFAGVVEVMIDLGFEAYVEGGAETLRSQSDPESCRRLDRAVGYFQDLATISPKAPTPTDLSVSVIREVLGVPTDVATDHPIP